MLRRVFVIIAAFIGAYIGFHYNVDPKSVPLSIILGLFGGAITGIMLWRWTDGKNDDDDYAYNEIVVRKIGGVYQASACEDACLTATGDTIVEALGNFLKANHDDFDIDIEYECEEE